MSSVSVILPVRNAAPTIARAVRSIQRQSFQRWELIIVDNDSSDGTSEVLQSLSMKEPRIRLETLKSSGIVAALNHGIAQASGCFIARMDADDVSHPDRLEKQISFLNENPEIGLVGSRIQYCGNTQDQRGYAAYVAWTNSLISWNDIRANRFIESPFAHPSVMFRESLISKAQEPYRTGNFPEDYELWLRWMSQGVKMAKLEASLLDWHDPPKRLSRTDERYSSDAFYRTKASYLAKWIQETKVVKRPIWIWGAGRITRKRASVLGDHGIRFAGYIDIDPAKTNRFLKDLPVIQPENLDRSKDPFVISYVGSRGAREKIRTYLLEQGFEEERDFILAA